jgi:hypothetical protein
MTNKPCSCSCPCPTLTPSAEAAEILKLLLAILVTISFGDIYLMRMEKGRGRGMRKAGAEMRGKEEDGEREIGMETRDYGFSDILMPLSVSSLDLTLLR